MPIDRPSLTRRGQRWLQNFAGDERSTAELLLDSLEIISATELQRGLRDGLSDLTTRLRPGPTVLIPALSIEDIRAEPNADGTHVAYRTFDPGSPIGVTPGSEALAGNAIRDLTGDSPGDEPSPRAWLHPGTSIATLRESRCRNLVLVTDYCGSGRQASDFARTFVRNPTIRSWRSFHWLRIIVTAFAASDAASRRLRRDPNVDDFITLRPAASFATARWTDAEAADIKDLCRKYVARRSRKYALGHKGSAGLFAMQTGVPNNIPLVLRQQSAGWHSFFEWNKFPQDLAADLASYSQVRDLTQVAAASNQLRLSEVIKSGRLNNPAAELAATLAILSYGRHDVIALAHKLNKPVPRIERLLKFLMSSGLVTSDHDLTPAGRRELQAAKRLPRTVTAHLEGDDSPYYPQRLR
ncbi:MAG TPA: hypothetical protein VGL05_14735 [Kribbella sp.]